MLCAPLGEKVGNFKVFNPVSVRHLNPAFEFCKVKAVFIALAVNIHKLNRGTLAADGGIKGWGENRGKKQIQTVLHSGFNKALNNLPVPLA